MSNELLNGVLDGITTSKTTKSKDGKTAWIADAPQIDISKLSVSLAKPERVLSPLQIANVEANNFFKDEQLSLSASFKVMRKGMSHIESYLIEVAKKGKKIDTDFVQDVVNVGTLSRLTATFTDKEIERTRWTAAQLFNIFKRSAIVKATK